MANPQVATIGSLTSHGGIVLTGNSLFPTGGVPLATVGSLHSCPVPGHGVNIVITGSGIVRASGSPVAIVGSVCSCGAVIISGSGVATASP